MENYFVNRLAKWMVAAAAVCSLLPPALAQQGGDELYRSLGGNAGIRRIVGDLLERVYADARLKATFKDADRDRLAAKLAEQFCQLGGGPCVYGGKDMKVIHEDLAITDAQFNALVEDLQAAMREEGVPFHAQNRLLAKLAPMRRDIVTK